MTQQKRSSSIRLSSMRKAFAVRPLALGIASVLLAACGEEKQDAKIYLSLEECERDNPSAVDACQAAYQTALDEASRTSPRYNSEYDCEYEFGANQCRQVKTDTGSFFMPFMAGFMVSQLLSSGRHYSQPIFTSYSPYSPYRSRWMMADGHVFDGDIRKRKYKVPSSTYQPKPTVSRTISRGGFGSTAKAKSSWGSSSRSGSWGG